MSKYMVAGRGGYPDNEFSHGRSYLDVSRLEFAYSKGEYDRTRNGYHDYDRDRDSRDRGRVRYKDTKERELMNGGYRSVSSRSYSGSSGSNGGRGPRRCEFQVGAIDREPGELSCESGSDEAIDSKPRGKDRDDLRLENGSQQLQSKKRKLSPLVWDRDKVSKLSPSEDSKLHSTEPQVESSIDTVSHLSAAVESPAGLSSSFQRQRDEYNEDVEQLNNEDYSPMRNIRSSRWAYDVNSPGDEGEFSNSPVEMRVLKKSISPDFGELKREGSEGSRARSPESDEGGVCSRSSGRDEYAEKDLEKNDYMEIDEEQNNGGTSVSHTDTDSEDQRDSRDTPELAAPHQRSVNMLQGCRSVDDFERLNKINEGTYGVVYRAKDQKTGEIVALKKVKMEKETEGFPLTSIREINILLSFNHPSIVDVKEVVVGSKIDSIYMVMEYMEHDLKALMETKKQPFSQSEVKCLMLQLLEGVKYLHDNWVLHRDLKTSNLLLNNRGELKMCDFGLARQYGSPLKPYTHLVVTLWYRAPELLLGAKQYSTAIDMWSLGCIMAELLLKKPLFNGKTELDQIDKIFRMLGTPNENTWPGFSKLPGIPMKFIKHQHNILRTKFPATSFTTPILSDAGFDLLNRLLTYDPEKRITADAALNHQWFREVPLPTSKDFLPTFPAQHDHYRRR